MEIQYARESFSQNDVSARVQSLDIQDISHGNLSTLRICKAQKGGVIDSSQAESKMRTRASLTSEDAVEIFKRSMPCYSLRTTAVAVAYEYRVSEKAVRDIWTARTWAEATRHLDPHRPPRTVRPMGRPLGKLDSKPRKRGPFAKERRKEATTSQPSSLGLQRRARNPATKSRLASSPLSCRDLPSLRSPVDGSQGSDTPHATADIITCLCTALPNHDICQPPIQLQSSSNLLCPPGPPWPPLEFPATPAAHLPLLSQPLRPFAFRPSAAGCSPRPSSASTTPPRPAPASWDPPSFLASADAMDLFSPASFLTEGHAPAASLLGRPVAPGATALPVPSAWDAASLATHADFLSRAAPAGPAAVLAVLAIIARAGVSDGPPAGSAALYGLGMQRPAATGDTIRPPPPAATSTAGQAPAPPASPGHWAPQAGLTGLAAGGPGRAGRDGGILWPPSGCQWGAGAAWGGGGPWLPAPGRVWPDWIGSAGRRA